MNRRAFFAGLAKLVGAAGLLPLIGRSIEPTRLFIGGVRTSAAPLGAAMAGYYTGYEAMEIRPGDMFLSVEIRHGDYIDLLPNAVVED